METKSEDQTNDLPGYAAVGSSQSGNAHGGEYPVDGEKKGHSNEAFNDMEAPPAYAPPTYYPVQQYPQQFQQYPPMQPDQPQVWSSTVITGQPMTYSMEQPPTIVRNVIVAPQPQSYCCLSCCIFWFCNCLFGGIAFVFSMMSMSAFDGGNVDKARSYARVSFWLNMAGVIVTTVTVFILFILLMAS